MPASVAATAFSSEPTNVNSHDVSLPATVAGDRMYVLVATDGTPAFTWPAGWTSSIAGVDGNDFAASSRLEVRYRQLDGSEGATIIVTTSGTAQQSVHRAWRVTGHNAAQAPEGAAAIARSATPDPPNLTPSWGAEDTLWFALYGMDGSSGGPATGFPLPDNQQSHESSADAGAVVQGNCSQVLNAASLNPGTFTTPVADDWRAVTIATRSAGGGGGGGGDAVPMLGLLQAGAGA